MCCLCGYYRVLGVTGCYVDEHCGMLCLWVLWGVVCVGVKGCFLFGC